MQITVTNGTLAQVQETLSAASGYLLPSSIVVSGATSSYSSSTGDITLTSPTSTMSITATAEEPQPEPGESGLFLGNLSIQKILWGTLPVSKIFLGNIEIYTSGPTQLDAPTISLSGDTLSIEEVENAEYYDIYVDGVLEESVSAEELVNLTIEWYDCNGDIGGSLVNGLYVKVNATQNVGVNYYDYIVPNDYPYGSLTIQVHATDVISVTAVASRVDTMSGTNCDVEYPSGGAYGERIITNITNGAVAHFEYID